MNDNGLVGLFSSGFVPVTVNGSFVLGCDLSQ